MMVEESVAASLFSVSAVINECTDFEQFALDWSDVSLKTWDAPEHSRQADMHLTITLGPSVMVGSTIVNSFSNVSGTLSIELEQKTTEWTVSQSNFGVYFAKSNYNTETRRLGFFIPVAFEELDSSEPPIPAVVMFACQTTDHVLSCDGPVLGPQQLVDRFYPNARKPVDLLGN
jgi:hypothetical protein